jgi:TolB protein
VNRIYTLNPDGSGLTKLADGVDPAWSPDGRQVAFAAGNGLYTIDSDGSNLKQVLARGNGPKGTSPGPPSWSPNGTRLLFEVTPDTTPARPGGFVAEIWTTKVDGTDQTRVYHGSCCTSTPTWSPDGTLIAFISDGLFDVGADGSDLRRLAPFATGEVAWQPIEQGGIR